MNRRVRFYLSPESIEKVLIKELVDECNCFFPFRMNKIGDSMYEAGFSRTTILVKASCEGVMVRVGGGWSPLASYLNKHDPCRSVRKGQCTERQQTAPTPLITSPPFVHATSYFSLLNTSTSSYRSRHDRCTKVVRSPVGPGVGGSTKRGLKSPVFPDVGRTVGRGVRRPAEYCVRKTVGRGVRSPIERSVSSPTPEPGARRGILKRGSQQVLQQVVVSATGSEVHSTVQGQDDIQETPRSRRPQTGSGSTAMRLRPRRLWDTAEYLPIPTFCEEPMEDGEDRMVYEGMEDLYEAYRQAELARSALGEDCRDARADSDSQTSTTIAASPGNPQQVDVNSNIIENPISVDVNNNIIEKPISVDVNNNIIEKPISVDVNNNIIEKQIFVDVNNNIIEKPISVDVNNNIVVTPMSSMSLCIDININDNTSRGTNDNNVPVDLMKSVNLPSKNSTAAKMVDPFSSGHTNVIKESYPGQTPGSKPTLVENPSDICRYYKGSGRRSPVQCDWSPIIEDVNTTTSPAMLSKSLESEEKANSIPAGLEPNATISKNLPRDSGRSRPSKRRYTLHTGTAIRKAVQSAGKLHLEGTAPENGSGRTDYKDSNFDVIHTVSCGDKQSSDVRGELDSAPCCVQSTVGTGLDRQPTSVRAKPGNITVIKKGCAWYRNANYFTTPVRLAIIRRSRGTGLINSPMFWR